MSDVLDTSPDAPGGLAHSPIARLLGLLVLAGLLVGIATWQVGPTPRPADEGLPTSPPPLALPSDEPDGSALSRAAAELASDDLQDANRRFVDIVAEDREGEAGQVGLVLSRWRSTGPISVERDLRQLAREYPESAYVALHLGLVQLLLEEDRLGRETLRTARELGLEAADPTSLRMARLADDLLNPGTFAGTMPVLVQPAEAAPAHRADLRRLLAVVAAGDRTAAARLAGELERTGDPFAELAATAARFDKGDSAPTVEALQGIARGATAAPVRDRARFLAALADLWAGGDRDRACAVFEELVRSGDPGTKRLAGPIRGEVCRG